jgi:hypothetical protein
MMAARDESETLSPPQETGAASKRRSEDGTGGPQPRAKRNRYISIAWCVSVLCFVDRGDYTDLCAYSVTSASGARSNATDRRHASAVETCLSNVYMRPIAATTSRNPSKTLSSVMVYPI